MTLTADKTLINLEALLLVRLQEAGIINLYRRFGLEYREFLRSVAEEQLR